MPAERQAPTHPSCPPGGCSDTADLLVSCPDAKGVVAALAQVVFGFGGNLLSSEQFTAEADASFEAPQFYQRLHMDLTHLHQGSDTTALEGAIAATAERFSMDWTLRKHGRRRRVALLVSKQDHCLFDVLYRQASGELDCDVALVASNHAEPGASIAARFGHAANFVHLPVDVAAFGGDRKAAKAAQEEALRVSLRGAEVDVVVLARYMQILSAETLAEFPDTINVHHSCLPAFEGARPYHRAHERGVKLIGATAHYVTPDLDCGPIIAQETVACSHRDGVADLARKGKDAEKSVLSKALRLHLANRVLVHGSKTIVWDE